MDTVSVIVDIIKDLGIKPMPSSQWFDCISVGYQVEGSTIIIRKDGHEPVWLQCNGPRVMIFPKGVTGRSIGNPIIIDLSDPNSLDKLRGYLQDYS